MLTTTMAATYGCRSNRATATGRRQSGLTRIRMLLRPIGLSSHRLDNRSLISDRLISSRRHRDQPLHGRTLVITEVSHLHLMAVITDHHRRQNLHRARTARPRCHRLQPAHTAVHLTAALRPVMWLREHLIAQLHIARPLIDLLLMVLLHIALLRIVLLHIVVPLIVAIAIVAPLRSILRDTIVTAMARRTIDSGAIENPGEIVVPVNGLIPVKITGKRAGRT